MLFKNRKCTGNGVDFHQVEDFHKDVGWTT